MKTVVCAIISPKSTVPADLVKISSVATLAYTLLGGCFQPPRVIFTSPARHHYYGDGRDVWSRGRARLEEGSV